MTTEQLIDSLPDRERSYMLVGCPCCKTLSGVIFYPNGACFHVNCNWKGKVQELWEPLPHAAKRIRSHAPVIA
jgi:hypothetical protein